MTEATSSGPAAVEAKQAPEPALLIPSTFTLGDALTKAGLPLAETMVIRHAYVKVHKDGFPGINADSTFHQILTYTSTQSRDTKIFKKEPGRYWVVFLPDLGTRARLWAVVENLGEIPNSGPVREFELRVLPGALSDLAGRLVIQWASPRAWWVNGTTGQRYPVMEVADAEPEPFPGFDHLVVDFDRLQAVISDPRYAAWRTALSSVIGIYLITDLSDGRQYVGKADGNDTLLQRWTAYATSGHGGNVELKKRERTNFQFSVLRVLDPSTASTDVNAVESHYKTALGTRTHGLNKN
ncbi:GIY-YIG nuclease family protein [Nocardioides speluncae]|uniref:GIY-YIG nuclease family protein n=1 Tax=Nocardioides speluncae TaxID=2670337 RepID=UPI000D687CA9|nr:GIY-YIG nuclease family protein [Nocardioides speluncae]